MEDEYHPELAEYEPFEPHRRSRRRSYLLRVVVIVAVLALVLPGVLTTYGLASSTAARACVAWARQIVDEQHRTDARWEWAGPGGMGWQCYAYTAEGERFVRSLGPIPVAPELIGVGAVGA
ncbi:hypothetical protein QT381_07250 [Galbitalea sp. SE-J8]|uniref:hypothetical protein n=1 Tax=Galbitalea sp. SE-J8 TaxID=3054952 RepID=UPI00259C6F2C|nr:hypothetical protein [Galbitalea sp. SE-J8]MDM4762801.1 hypothetical protein [Galbitalea sp. SE-J8]